MHTKPNLPFPACRPGAFTSPPVCSGISRRCCDALPMSSATSQPRACMKVMLSWLLSVCERPPGRDARPMSNEGGGVHTKGRPLNTRHDYCCKIAISNNVGGVKHCLSTLRPALGKERHFALVEGFAFQ